MIGVGAPQLASNGTGERITDEERAAWAVLAAVDGVGPRAFTGLLHWFGTASAVLDAAAGPGAVERLAATPAHDPHDGSRVRRPVSVTLAGTIADAAHAATATLARLDELGIRVVIVDELAYPARLAKIAMPPHVLFVQGAVEAVSARHAVAIVGTRRATSGGRATAGRIATALVAADAAVVSGLAYGIDGAAHEATIRAGGTTVAVIGGGHAVAVPSGHVRLASRILATGGAIVSESPPDVGPTVGTYPRRNRIISGLSSATVVVEAPPRSGALITASWALDQGRGCYLVPGPMDAISSSGCHAFLREFAPDARIVAGVPQLIADLGLVRDDAGPGDGVTGATLQDLGRTERRLAEALLAGHVTVDELVAVTTLPVGAVLATLNMLEDRGLVRGVHGRYRPSGSLLGEVTQARPR